MGDTVFSSLLYTFMKTKENHNYREKKQIKTRYIYMQIKRTKDNKRLCNFVSRYNLLCSRNYKISFDRFVF